MIPNSEWNRRMANSFARKKSRKKLFEDLSDALIGYTRVASRYHLSATTGVASVSVLKKGRRCEVAIIK